MESSLSWIWILLLGLVPSSSSAPASTLRLSDTEMANLLVSGNQSTFLDTLLKSPIDVSAKTGFYRLVGMVTCPPIKSGCPFSLPGSGVVTLMDADKLSADDEIDRAAITEEGRFNLKADASDPFWGWNKPDPYINIQVLCPHVRGGYDQLEWTSGIYRGSAGFEQKYMKNEREMEFHFAANGSVSEYRDMSKVGRELLYDSCMKTF